MNKQINLFCIVLVLSAIIFTSCPPPPEVVAVTGVSLSQSELTLNVNESVALNATVSPENASNKNVSWSSSDETVATVDTNGLVKALKAGTTTITVKTEDGEKTATCSVTVKYIMVSGISFYQTSITLDVDESITLTATIKPNNATNKNISWSSSDEKVATVDTNGLVKALKEGTATITAKTEDRGYAATCKVTVVKSLFVQIPACTFAMGSTSSGASDKEQPVHNVTLSSYFICEHEVTQREYLKYCYYSSSNTPSSGAGKGDNYPVYYVSWYDAVVYCNLRSIDEGLTPCYKVGDETDPTKWEGIRSDNNANPRYFGPDFSNDNWNQMTCDWSANGYRLPTEAEWECAARGGISETNVDVWAGTKVVDQLSDYAWYNGSASLKSHEVKKKKPNGYGLYDMSGNVWEWCWDWYCSYSNGDVLGTTRMVRGGYFNNAPDSCRVSYRNFYGPNTSRLNSVGFRLARSVK